MVSDSKVSDAGHSEANLPRGDGANDYVIRSFDDPRDVDAEAWDALLRCQPAPTPFMRHAFLTAAHASGSAVPGTGWAPVLLTIRHHDELVAGCALYAKAHSYGEYVFDWSWANAFERNGRAYYPKLLGAVPFTPVPGTRLLARDDAIRDLLVSALESLARQARVSSAHLLFADDADIAALARRGWLIRRGVQFHWSQPAESPHGSFASFLSTLQREKRKKIAQERRRVQEAGIQCRALEGTAINRKDWDFFYRCYANTYAEHGSPPYLRRAFFESMMTTMPEHWLMFIAERAGQPIAASLIAIDPLSRIAWGRYWGAVEHVPMLHFEACYYQPLAWCIENGYLRFEGGAQGEHKMARGLMPVETASAHWIADASFAKAISEFLEQESQGVARYLDELEDRSPYKDAAG